MNPRRGSRLWKMTKDIGVSTGSWDMPVSDHVCVVLRMGRGAVTDNMGELVMEEILSGWRGRRE